MAVIKYRKKRYLLTSRRDFRLHLISLLRGDLGVLLHAACCIRNAILLHAAAFGTRFCCMLHSERDSAACCMLHSERDSAAGEMRPAGFEPTTTSLNSFVGRHRLYHSASLQTLRALCLKAYIVIGSTTNVKRCLNITTSRNSAKFRDQIHSKLSLY